MIAPELQDHLLATGEVADLLRVVPQTVGRWASLGVLPSFKTPGGARRYWAGLVLHRAKSGCHGCDRCTP